MQDWTKMGAGQFRTRGAQLDMFAGIEGDGYGTLDLLEMAEAGTVAPVDEGRADGALFGLAFSEAPTTDGGLFSVVAA